MQKNKYSFPHFLIYILLLFGFVNICWSENVKKSIDENRDDTGESNDEPKDESLDIAVENETTNTTCTRRRNSAMHEIQKAQHRQFPFMAAVMSHQNEFLCSGTVISNGLVLTTAKCAQQPVSYVLLNATKALKDETTAMVHVIKTEKFPTYTGSESLKDVGLLYTEKHNSSVASKIRLSNYTSARDMTDLEGVGFGLNADTGSTRELQFVGMELRPLLVEQDILKAFFDCVETKVNTCFKDTGGPAIFNNELVGIVIVGQEECTREMSSSYAINKRLADILPTYTFKAWLDEKIKKNEDQEEQPLQVYPAKPPVAARRFAHQMVTPEAKSYQQKVTPTMKIVLGLCLILVAFV